MDRVALPLSLHCPDHKAQAIGMLNMDLSAKKLGYCYECIAENCGDGSLPKTLKPVSNYLKDTSSFYEKCRQRTFNVGEPPAKYLEELSKKGERLEKLSKHIDEEKDKMKRTFEEIRITLIQIIDNKEKECFELIGKEIVGLSEAYTNFEKILIMGWPKASEVQNVFPGTDILEQKMSQIENMEQLRAFMTGIQEDVKMHEMYFKKEEENGLTKIEKKLDGLTRSLNRSEGSLPKVNMGILTSENVTKDLMKGFSEQEVKVENSIVSRMKAAVYESKVAIDDHFEILKDWLPINLT